LFSPIDSSSKCETTEIVKEYIGRCNIKQINLIFFFSICVITNEESYVHVIPKKPIEETNHAWQTMK
jgi:hypothetical protein